MIFSQIGTCSPELATQGSGMQTMKTIIAILAAAVGAMAAPVKAPPRYPWNVWLDYGLLVDGRDHRHYKTVEIDSLQWTAENMRFVTDSSWCFERDTTNCEVYGRYYRGLDAALACPKGWRLPTADEWRSLLHKAGDGHAMTRLTSTKGWGTYPTSKVGRILSKWIKPIPPRPTRFKPAPKPQAPAVDPDPESDDRLGFRIIPAGLRVVPQVHHVQPTTGYGEASAVETPDEKAHPRFGLEFGVQGYAAYLWADGNIDTALSMAPGEESGIEIHDNTSFDLFGFSVRCVKPNRN